VQKLVRLTLELEGHEVTVVDRGLGAVTVAHDIGAELVVLDVMLPGVDGIDVCRSLRAEPATTRVGILMLSARAQAADVAAGLAAGADTYVTKPFEPRDLALQVAGVLRGSTARRS